ncbi:alpha/beta hydrolase [Betaproteobacteria bacterium GR16-43]|nr:alpha/beta hydrolase [Betaproteobacteria bacterium GR16-43]
MAPALFPGFRDERFRVEGHEVAAWVGGSGPPLLLLHGYPQTRALWHKVAPRLARRFTVVAADLRGYGDSGKPESGPGHAGYSKRAMAADPAALMQALGHPRYFLAGHDRGGRVAHRLAMDYSERVLRVAVLDIAPTLAMYEQTTEAFARAYWHWFFLILPKPQPERMLGADPIGYLRFKISQGRAGLAPFAPEALAEYERCFTPESIHTMCEDYRAAATIDLVHDRADRDAGRKLSMPLLALWGAHGVVEHCFKPLDEWRRVADDVRGSALPAGHYLPEEVPDLVADEFESFFK